MRLFLAIPLPDDVRNALAGAVDEAAENEVPHWGDPIANWVRAENLHVTLKFLGDVAEPDVDPLVADLDRLGKPGPIALRTAGLEVFPPRGPVRMIAAAVDGELERLVPLHRSIERACECHRVQPDGRPFRPHVTLGRVRRGVDVDRRTIQSLAGLDRLPAVDFVAAEFTLYASQLLPDGPRYTVVQRFPLAAGT